MFDSEDPALHSAHEALRDAEMRRTQREMELLSLIGGGPSVVPIPPPSPEPVMTPSLARVTRVADDFIKYNSTNINGTYSAKPSPKEVMMSITSPTRRTTPSAQTPTISSLRKRTPERDRIRSRTPQTNRTASVRNRKRYVSPQRSNSLPGSEIHKELQKNVQIETMRENIHKEAAASAAARIRNIAQSSTVRPSLGSPGRGGYAAVVTSSSPREIQPSLNLITHASPQTLVTPPTTPPSVVVSEAGRTVLNGIYYLCVPGVLDDVNVLYRSEKQTCSLYLKNGRWKLNDSSDTSGWIYSASTLIGQWEVVGGGEGDIGYGYPKLSEPSDVDIVHKIATENNNKIVTSDPQYQTPPPMSPRLLNSPLRSVSPQVNTRSSSEGPSIWASQEKQKSPNYAPFMLAILLFLSILAGWSLHSLFAPPPAIPLPPPPPKHEPFVHDGRVCTLSNNNLYCTEIPGAAKIDGSRVPNKNDVEVVDVDSKAEKCANPN